MKNEDEVVLGLTPGFHIDVQYLSLVALSLLFVFVGLSVSGGVCLPPGWLFGCSDKIPFISSTLYYWESLQGVPVIPGQEGSSRCLCSASALP